MQMTSSLLDLEVKDDDSSTCSSFTVATVLSRNSRPPSSMLHEDSLSGDGTYNYSGDACTDPIGIGNPTSEVYSEYFAVSNDGDETWKSHADVVHKTQTTTITYDVEELHKLRCTSSLMDDSFDSALDNENNVEQEEENNKMVALSSPVVTINMPMSVGDESNYHVSVEKTTKKSNCRRDALKADKTGTSNRDSIFRKPDLPAESSITEPTVSAKTPIQAPYDETSNNSFDVTTSNSLVDYTFESFDVIDKEESKCRRRSNKFLSVYDDLSAQAIQKAATFESNQSKKKVGNSRVRKMSAAFSTAVQSMADGITSQAAGNTHCSIGGSWDVDDGAPSLSGKKRPLADIGNVSNLRKPWGGSLNYVQMQLLAEREEERNHYTQELKNCKAQIKYLQHENITAYESVTLARSESLVAAQSKKEVELERDTLKKQVNDSQKECNTMKEAMLALAEAEKHRVKTINRLERKLEKAKTSLETVSTLASDAEKQVTSLRDTIDQLQTENMLLSDELKCRKEQIEKECNMHNDKLLTARKEAKKWQLQAEENCIEIKLLQMKLTTAKKSRCGKNLADDIDMASATPKQNDQAEWGLINAFGAEDVTGGSELFNQQTYAHKQSLQTAIMSPAGQSSCRLLYGSSSAEKENQCKTSSPLLIEKICLAKQQRCQKCCLCFKDPSGVMKSCECGQTECNKRAHSTCLAKFKVGNISNSVSHPGTPVTQMPLILCTGLWKK